MRVYIAGPLTNGGQVPGKENVELAIEMGELVLRHGHEPFIPHLYYYWHQLFPHHHNTWMELDLKWLRVCDALIRLPGDSPGADKEVALAEELHIPVFFSLEEFLHAKPKAPAKTTLSKGELSWDESNSP